MVIESLQLLALASIFAALTILIIKVEGFLDAPKDETSAKVASSVAPNEPCHFDYKVVPIARDHIDLLHACGKDGWELAGFSRDRNGPFGVFKRPASSQSNGDE